MGRLDLLVTRAATALGVLAAVLLFAIMMVMVADVSARYLLNRPILGAFEITEFLMCLMILSAMPLVGLRGRHVEASLMAHLVPRLDRAMRVLAGLASIAVFATIAVVLWRYAGQLARQDAQSLFAGIPHAPFAYAASVLFGAAALVAVFVLFRGVRPGPDSGAVDP